MSIFIFYINHRFLYKPLFNLTFPLLCAMDFSGYLINQLPFFLLVSAIPSYHCQSNTSCKILPWSMNQLGYSTVGGHLLCCLCATVCIQLAHFPCFSLLFCKYFPTECSFSYNWICQPRASNTQPLAVFKKIFPYVTLQSFDSHLFFISRPFYSWKLFPSFYSDWIIHDFKYLYLITV